MRRLDNPHMAPRGQRSAEKTNCPGHCNGKGHHSLTVTIGIGSKTPCLALPTTNRRSPSMVGQSQWLRLSSSWLPFLIIFCGEFLFRWKFASLDKNGRTILAMFKRMLQRTFILPGYIGCQKEREKWKNWFWCFFKCQMSNPGGWLWTRMLYVWDKMKILGAVLV